MNERKKCLTCGKYLISFQGCYLHPETPCAGLKDSIYIEAEVEDEELQKKFEGIYGKPDMDDYERVARLEELVNKPLIRFLLKFI